MGIATRDSDQAAQKVEARLALEPGWNHKGHLQGCGAGRAGVLRAQLLSSNLGCLETVLGRVLPFQYPGRAGEGGDQDP